MEKIIEDILEKMSKLEVTNIELNSRISSLESKLLKYDRVNSESSSGDESEEHVNVTLYKKGIKVSGNTKPHKDMIKKHGGRWNSMLKSWIFTIEKGTLFSLIASKQIENIIIEEQILSEFK